MKKPSLGATANVALIIAASALTWNTVVLQRAAQPSAPAVKALRDVEQEAGAGIAIGPADAAIQIVELMDFQCPFCARWSATLDSLEAELPGAVRVTFHHWPLTTIHNHALAAAIAGECAHEQGAFTEMRKALFALQDSLGVRNWAAFAEDAGVTDVEAFKTCIQQPAEAFPRIQYGIDLAKRVGATGTPTVWVNGQVKRPTLDELRKLAEDAKP
jgi:protein-disulfide isomerase